MNENIFREYDIRGIVGEQLTDETVLTAARAVGTLFNRNGAQRIAVGFDARSSSPRFRDLLVKGFNETGCDVILIGKVPTPVLYHTVYTREVDGGDEADDECRAGAHRDQDSGTVHTADARNARPVRLLQH